MWWLAWRTAVHGKDEALRFIREFVQEIPICSPTDAKRNRVCEVASHLVRMVREQQAGRRAMLDWLRRKFDVEKPSQKLQEVATLDADTLAAEVQKARGKRQPLSAAQVKALKEEHARSVVPLQVLSGEARQLERQVADLVNAAYGLTPEEGALMWRTAPPRMPGEAGRVTWHLRLSTIFSPVALMAPGESDSPDNHRKNLALTGTCTFVYY